ncbi:hypothetical protein ABI_32930 [Asticcacaulis biprosthecium C19]|uniref:Uncharacterized protein n=1 Tax=Asticcacaulis biprosthecium C19 TaxID=715226 RepID=F4QPZ0_9CAUL|nr:hypothetical protein ABI_32930 [Asticcacaulis biprosthecium C19]
MNLSDVQVLHGRGNEIFIYLLRGKSVDSAIGVRPNARGITGRADTYT